MFVDSFVRSFARSCARGAIADTHREVERASTGAEETRKRRQGEGGRREKQAMTGKTGRGQRVERNGTEEWAKKRRRLETR